ncbi:MAG: hypothetical protein JWO54_352 [Candidatus Saccharibacteria bacterium]|nr:hypothetical protein [Candidatus Saccharibacteria bacterium]MDB5180594.1 hypothetical protein [Candidatus Saccharibacteria bacterium]
MNEASFESKKSTESDSLSNEDIEFFEEDITSYIIGEFGEILTEDPEKNPLDYVDSISSKLGANRNTVQLLATQLREMQVQGRRPFLDK